MPDAESSIDSVGLKSDVARLMLRCAGHLDDRAAEIDGWKIYYAVDVDVITLFLDPDEHSGNASVFRSREDDRDKKMLAQLLGEFVFFKLADSVRLLIPPHDRELRFQIDSLVAAAVNATETALSTNRDAFKALWARIQTQDLETAAETLLTHAPVLVEMSSGGSGPAATLRRFQRIGDSRLLNITQYRDPDSGEPLPFPQFRFSRDDFEDITEAFQAWRERLMDYRDQNDPHILVDNDARVLATLEWINRRLFPDKKRVVLLTCTDSVMRAAGDCSARHLGGGDQTFADLLIRHPQSVMIDPRFFDETATDAALGDGSEDRSIRVFNWLNLLFPDAARNDNQRTLTPTIDRQSIRDTVALARDTFSKEDQIRSLRKVLENIFLNWRM
jgi:hypothetical protein